MIDLTEGTNVIAPHSVHYEIGSAFSVMLKRNRITLQQSLQAIEVYRKIPIRFVDISLEESLDIAAHPNNFAYDAYIIPCALKRNLPLFSLDQRLIKNAEERVANSRCVRRVRYIELS